MNSKAKAQISRFCWKSSGLVHWVMGRSNISDSFSTNYFYLFSNKRVSRVSEQKFVLGQPGVLEFKWVSEFWILSWELTLKKKIILGSNFIESPRTAWINVWRFSCFCLFSYFFLCIGSRLLSLQKKRKGMPTNPPPPLICFVFSALCVCLYCYNKDERSQKAFAF